MNEIKEVFYGIYSADELKEKSKRGEVLLFKAKRPVAVGRDCLLKVNMNIGVSDKVNYSIEI